MSDIDQAAPASACDSDIWNTLASYSRGSGRYAPRRGAGRTYVYEASWKQVTGMLVWNCTSWQDDFSGVFRGGAMPWPLGDAWEQVRRRIEMEIDRDVDQIGCAGG